MKYLSVFATVIFMIVGFSAPLRAMELAQQKSQEIEEVADAWLEAEPERLDILVEAFNSLPGDEPLSRERMRWLPKGCQQLIAQLFLIQCKEEEEEAARLEMEQWVEMERMRYQAWQRPRDFWPMIDENDEIL